MDWKTSNHMDGSEIRDSIGLQYFAEDGNTSDTGADMDGFDAVSYTHLDVYKRQGSRRLTASAVCLAGMRWTRHAIGCRPLRPSARMSATRCGSGSTAFPTP